MKVMHISVNFIGSKLYKNMFNKLYGLGIDQIVITPVHKKSKEKNNDIFGYEVVYQYILNFFCRVFYFYKIKKIYNEIINKNYHKGITFIHAHTLFSDGGVAYLLNKKFNIPYMVAIRNTDINAFLKYKKYLKYFGIRIINNAEQIVFLSSAYRDSFIKIMPKSSKNVILKKSIIIPNGIDDYWFNNAVLEMKKTNTDIHFLFIGAIDKNKNLSFNLQVCSELIKNGYSTTLDVVGDGDELENCKIIANNLNISDNVIFHGLIKNRDKLREIMSNCNIFLLNSKYETFGLVYAEALSQGLWLLYTKNQGFDNQFNEGEVGYPVEYNNVTQCLNCILKIKKQKVSNYKVPNLIERFNWDKIAKTYIDIYSKEQ